MGATAGAVSGALTDVGINDNFMKESASRWLPAVDLIRSREEIYAGQGAGELKGTGGRVLKTSLSNEDEPSCRLP